MDITKLAKGKLVEILTGEWKGYIGIVSQEISEGEAGHVLIHAVGNILGYPVSINDVAIADKTKEGFSQLAYSLINLESHIIEARLIG